MTYGSCQRMCESKVQAWVKPSVSARLVSSTTRQAGGAVCRVTPKSMLARFLLLLVPPLAELCAAPVRVQLHQEDAVELDGIVGREPQEARSPVRHSPALRRGEDLVGTADASLRPRHVGPVLEDPVTPPGRFVEGGLAVGRVCGEQVRRRYGVPVLPGSLVSAEPAIQRRGRVHLNPSRSPRPRSLRRGLCRLRRGRSAAAAGSSHLHFSVSASCPPCRRAARRG